MSNKGKPIPDLSKDRIAFLINHGLVERTGRNKVILSKQFHAFMKIKGVYTRNKGLDRNTNKALLLQHIRENSTTGSTMEDFQQVLPSLSRGQIWAILRSLREETKIYLIGKGKGALWHYHEDKKAHKSTQKHTKAHKPTE